jgi:hypothetical protein
LLVGKIEVVTESLQFGHDLLTFLSSDRHDTSPLIVDEGLRADGARRAEMSGFFWNYGTQLLLAGSKAGADASCNRVSL